MSECPICFEIINEEYITQCSHKFCKVCANIFPQKNIISCPLCRQPLQNNTQLNYPDIAVSSEPIYDEINGGFTYPLLTINPETHQQSSSYFNNFQPYYHQTPNIDTYSFALNPETYHPSGSLNISLYARTYNILHILDGNGQLLRYST